MKHNYLKHLFTALLLLCATVVTAHDFEVDGIYYKITDKTNKTVEVTYQGAYYYTYDNEYTGTVVIPQTVTYGYRYTVTSIGYEAFSGCTGLTSVTIPNSVTSIDSYAFSACTGLKEISIPNSVTSIGGSAFNNCYSLISITIPDNVTWINKNTFSGCKNLTEITIPNSVKCIEYSAFSGCKSLTEVTIPYGVTSIADETFWGCTCLTSVTIPNSVKSIGQRAFQDCTSLTEITIPNRVTSIDYKAFRNCTSLTTLNFNAENCTRMGGENSDLAFYGCNNLVTINIGDKVKRIPTYAFIDCIGLTEITIPNSVTTIGYAAFSGCTGLTEIAIPNNVTLIYNYAFSDCTGLTEIRVEATIPPTIYSYTFAQVDKSIPLYVPAESIATYRSADYWSEFTNIVEMIPTEVIVTINQYGSATYCSPYALDFSNVEGLKAYSAIGYKPSTQVVTLARVMTTGAGQGVFIKGEPGEYTVPVIDNFDEYTLNMLVGTLEQTVVNSTDGAMSNYKFTIAEGDEAPMFYPFEDNTTFSAGKAYLQIPTAWLPATAQKSVSIRFDEGETTDIDEVKGEGGEVKTVYDLQGRLVENPTSGIYIVNGKKVIIK